MSRAKIYHRGYHVLLEGGILLSPQFILYIITFLEDNAAFQVRLI